MGIWIKTGSSTWTQIASAFMKTSSAAWSELLSVWSKTGASTWIKVFDKPNVPTTLTSPFINDYLDTGRVDNVTYISNVGDTIYGHRGSWNYSPTSYLYKWQWSSSEDGIYQDFNPVQTSTAHPTPLNTLVSWDDRWVRFAVRATNAIGSSDYILSSNAAHLVKYIPSNISISVTGSATVGSTLTATSTWQNTVITAGDRSPNYFTYEWTYGDGTATVNTGSNQTYVPTTGEIGKTLKVKVTAFNTGGDASATSTATAAISVAIGILNVSFTDINGRSGRDYLGNLVTAAQLRLNFTVSSVVSSTSIRVRYRVLNNQTGAYYNPTDTTTTYTSAQSAAWLSYSGTAAASGTLSNVTTVNGIATVYDSFIIDTFFNGSTYGGGLYRWTFEYEISAVDSGGVRRYWNFGNYVTSTQANDFYDIAPATAPTITSNVTTSAKNTAITFSGALPSFPISLNSYPSAYKIDYGDSTDSGWISTDGTANPAYSKSKSYSSNGSYTATIETTPYYTTATRTVTIADVPTPPTSLTAAVDTGSIVLTFSGGSGSQYDIYYVGADTRPTDGQAFTDFANVTSPYTATTLTSRDSNRYFWVRKSTGAVRSNWFPAAGGVLARLPLFAPPAPTSPTTGGVSKTNITFGWTASGTPSSSQDAHSGYEYYTSTTSTAPTAGTAATGSVASNVVSVSFTYIASTSPSTQYFWVRAINKDAKSAWTTAVSATPVKLFTVTFSLNGGGGTASADKSQTTTSNEITLPAVGSMTAPTGKPNFSGWVSTAAGTTALTSPYTPTADITLYAYWTANTSFTVTFKANGGTGADYTQSATTSTALSANTFTRVETFVTPVFSGALPGWTAANNFQRTTGTGAFIRYGWNNGSQTWSGTINTYAFSGWNTAANGTGTAYAAGASYGFTANLTLFAQWTATRSGRGYNWELRSTSSTANTTNITDSGYRSFSTVNDTRATVQGTNFIYLLRSDGTAGQRDIAYSSLARNGRVQTYQFGSDGNEYDSGWTIFI